MLRIIGALVKVELLLLVIFLVCNSLASPKNAMAWFAFISLTLLGLTVAGWVIQSRQR
jgi:hypothetical protein